MEKLILALVNAARKLRPYFQAYTIEVPTEYPMKQVLQPESQAHKLCAGGFSLKEAPASKKESNAWEARP